MLCFYSLGRLLETDKPVYLYDVEIQINRFFYFIKKSLLIRNLANDKN